MRSLEGVKAVRWRADEDENSTVEMWVTKMPNSPARVEALLPSTMVANVPPPSLPPKMDSVLTAPDRLIVSSPVGTTIGRGVKSPVLLQSPLCSSSSNAPTIPQPMDTASMLDSLGLLDSKVENILNTSVSSTAVEVSYPISEDPANTDDKMKHLNVTFDAEANLNSTFNKDDLPEVNVNLNETFEKPDENKFELPVISVEQDSHLEKLNGTFCLEQNSTKAAPLECDGHEADG